VDRMPNSVRARANYAQGLILEDRPAEVVPVLERALELAPHDPTSLVNLAAAQEQLGNFAAAADCYRRLRGYYPSDWKNWRMHGSALLVLEDWEGAEEAFRNAIERDASPAELHYSRAAALFALNRDAEAEVELREATARDPAWPERVLGLARSVILDERSRASPEACRSALGWARLGMRALERPSIQHLDTLALCYAATGDFDQAAETARKALKDKPGGAWGAVHRDRLGYYERRKVPWSQ
jgi:tetratricopeptide (TPR) repeat protein